MLEHVGRMLETDTPRILNVTEPLDRASGCVARLPFKSSTDSAASCTRKRSHCGGPYSSTTCVTTGEGRGGRDAIRTQLIRNGFRTPTYHAMYNCPVCHAHRWNRPFLVCSLVDWHPTPSLDHRLVLQVEARCGECEDDDRGDLLRRLNDMKLRVKQVVCGNMFRGLGATGLEAVDEAIFMTHADQLATGTERSSLIGQAEAREGRGERLDAAAAEAEVGAEADMGTGEEAASPRTVELYLRLVNGKRDGAIGLLPPALPIGEWLAVVNDQLVQYGSTFEELGFENIGESSTA